MENRTVKMSQVIAPNFTEGLNSLINSLTGGDLPIKASYAILNANEKILKLQASYESLRKVLIEKHGARDEKDELVMNEEKTKYVLKDTEAFDKEFEDLLNLEVDIPTIPLSYVQDARIPLTVLPVMLKTLLNVEL